MKCHTVIKMLSFYAEYFHFSESDIVKGVEMQRTILKLNIENETGTMLIGWKRDVCTYFHKRKGKH